MYFKREDAHIYYQKIGSGPPLVLLHGNGEDHTIFKELGEALKRSFTLYLIDSRNHGSSTSSSPYSYESSAKDMIALFDSLELEDAFLLGFSDGGIIGLLISIMKPKLLSGLIVAGANISPKGLKKTCLQAIKQDYDTHHRPSDWLMLHEPNIKKEDLMRISIPTLIIAGENDVVRRSHTYSIARHIPDSRLLILEGRNHFDYIMHSSLLEHIVREFVTENL